MADRRKKSAIADGTATAIAEDEGPARGPVDGSLQARVEAWQAMVSILPISAALVDQDGRVVTPNRWIEAEPGDPLITPATEQAAPGLRFGVDGTSRWRVRRLTSDGAYMLATAEREDAGDHLLRKFFASHDSLFVVYDQWGRVIESNQAWESLLGYTHDEVFGLEAWTLLPPDSDDRRQEIEEVLLATGRCEPTFKMRAADGTYRDIAWTLHFDASVGRCFGFGRDVTVEGERQAELTRRAFTDELTGLPNRARLLDELEQLMSGPSSPGILFCDLDRFKVINDSLGHQAGDELLEKLSKRLDTVVDQPDSMVARMGGDEFVALIGHCDEARATATARAMIEALSDPFEIAGRPIHASMSIGIAVADEAGPMTAEDLLGAADTAAYRAKQLGRNRSIMFDEAMRRAVDRRFEVEQGIRTALVENQLELCYQPIVRLADGSIMGLEALVRWRTPGGRLLGPGSFLDVADEAGIMGEVGRQVHAKAFRTASELTREGRRILMSVNVSSTELASPTYVDMVLSLLDGFGLDPSRVLLEINESAILSTEATPDVLSRLSGAGIQIGLDDFGTGYSSLAHLRKLPIDVVKIDRSFIDELVADEVTRAVTGSLIELCQALDLTVVMEGIESVDQAAVAEQLGGELAQGHFFHQAVGREELKSLLGQPIEFAGHLTS